MKKYILIVIIGLLSSCSNFLDIVPDSVATIKDAFTTRNQAEKYLFTCWSYMPSQGVLEQDPAMNGSDEYCYERTSGVGSTGWNLQHGRQSAASPIFSRWASLWEGISTCNIFLENVASVPDLSQNERNRWIAEIKFLKAYYHFYLIRMYGPIPIKDVDIPVGSSPEKVKVFRDPLNDCFNYVTNLLEEIILSEHLPKQIEDRAKEMGRITQEIAYAFKAYVMVYRASPLFNGNSDYAGIEDKQGREIFSPNATDAERIQRWSEAALACKKAIDFSHSLDRKLYSFKDELVNADDDTYKEVELRSILTDSWNEEVIWANSKNLISNNQQLSVPRGMSNYSVGAASWRAILGSSLKHAYIYYTANGVPIEEDVTWDYNKRHQITKVDDAHANLMIKNYEVANFQLNRETRFYSHLFMDGGLAYAYNKTNEPRADVNPMTKTKHYAVAWRASGHCFTVGTNSINTSGYSPKKFVHYKSNLEAANQFQKYPFVVIRLADLYLLYAESLNEAGASQDDVLEYVDKVRERAGLKKVVDSWSTYSNRPDKYSTQAGRRDIIHRERGIELAFEGKRFWDLRRWKKGVSEVSKPVTGWSYMESDPTAYYTEKILYTPIFGIKDYFWPISQTELLDNPNLVQNYGW